MAIFKGSVNKLYIACLDLGNEIFLGLSFKFVCSNADMIDTNEINHIIDLVCKIFQRWPLALFALTKSGIRSKADNAALLGDASNQVVGTVAR